MTYSEKPWTDEERNNVLMTGKIVNEMQRIRNIEDGKKILRRRAELHRLTV